MESPVLKSSSYPVNFYALLQWTIPSENGISFVIRVVYTTKPVGALRLWQLWLPLPGPPRAPSPLPRTPCQSHGAISPCPSDATAGLVSSFPSMAQPWHIARGGDQWWGLGPTWGSHPQFLALHPLGSHLALTAPWRNLHRLRRTPQSDTSVKANWKKSWVS